MHVDKHRLLDAARAVPLTARLAERLVIGRTAALQNLLQQTRLFNFFDAGVLYPDPAQGLPRRGTAAAKGDRLVFILDTFSRYGVPSADVAALLPAAPCLLLNMRWCV